MRRTSELVLEPRAPAVSRWDGASGVSETDSELDTLVSRSVLFSKRRFVLWTRSLTAAAARTRLCVCVYARLRDCWSPPPRREFTCQFDWWAGLGSGRWRPGRAVLLSIFEANMCILLPRMGLV